MSLFYQKKENTCQPIEDPLRYQKKEKALVHLHQGFLL
jgi:hypothetical protein